MNKKTSGWEIEFDEAMIPKVYCGGDHCTGMWNLECDDINHNDGRELVVKSKVKFFISDLLAKEKMELVERILDMLNKEADGWREDNKEYKANGNIKFGEGAETALRKVANDVLSALKSEIQEEVGG